MTGGFKCLMAMALAAALSGGCGKKVSYGPTGTVRGKLTYEGKAPRDKTSVVFQQVEKGFLAYGIADATGNFEMKGFNDGRLPIGKYEVTIQPAPAKAESDIDAHKLIDDPTLAQQTVAKADFPKKYQNAHTSKLSYDVKEGPNVYDLDLKAN